MSLASLYIYGGIIVWLFITGIGIPPVPEEVGIIGAGVAATHREVVWWLAWPACIIGIVSADLCLYGAGRLWGRRLFEYRWVQRFLPTHRREKIAEGFNSHGVKILLTGRLLPGLRTGVFMVAGAIHYPFIRFLIADGLYAIPGVGLIFFASFFLGESIWQLVQGVHQVQYWIVIALILALAGYGVYWYVQFLRRRAATDDFEPPHLPELIHPGADPHAHVPNVAAQADTQAKSPTP